MKPGDVSAMYVAPLQKAMLYKYTNTQIQIQIHKYKLDMAGKGATDT